MLTFLTAVLENAGFFRPNLGVSAIPLTLIRCIQNGLAKLNSLIWTLIFHAFRKDQCTEFDWNVRIISYFVIWFKDSKEENNILLSQPSGKENVPLQKRSAEPRIGDSQTPQGTPVSPSPKVAQSPSREVLEEEKVALEERIDEFGKTAQGIGESLENEIEKKVFLNDREKLLSTTKEVLSAMGEIREFIKEQKSE